MLIAKLLADGRVKDADGCGDESPAAFAYISL
jgi:hypothetical protein